MEHHPIDKIYRTGVSIGVNTDARTISDVTLTNEYESLSSHFGWQKADFKKCNLEAIEHAFVSKEIKNELRNIIISAYQ